MHSSISTMKKGGSIPQLLLFWGVSSFLFYTVLVAFITPSCLKFSMPIGIWANCLFVLKLIFWASFEELLYRVYFPNKLQFFFLSLSSPSILRCLWVYTLPHLLFALAHSYLGILNVIFAFFSSIFLRKLYTFCEFKLGVIFSFAIICIFHSVYNICVLYFHIT